MLSFESVEWVKKVMVTKMGRHHKIHWDPNENKKVEKGRICWYLCLSSEEAIFLWIHSFLLSLLLTWASQLCLLAVLWISWPRTIPTSALTTSRTPRSMRSMTTFCMGSRRRSKHSPHLLLEGTWHLCHVRAARPRSCLESSSWGSVFFSGFAEFYMVTCLLNVCGWSSLGSGLFVKWKALTTRLTCGGCVLLPIYVKCCTNRMALCVHVEGVVDHKHWKVCR